MFLYSILVNILIVSVITNEYKVNWTSNNFIYNVV